MAMFRFEEIMNLQMQPYMKQLACYPVIMMSGKERTEVDKGGKIILPASALEYLTRQQIQYPMLFKLTNRSKNRKTHCGVLEFVAEEGRCYLPYWMMKNLLINEGEVIQVEYVSLQIANFAKFQPQSVDFLEITNPKAVLENTLRNFATLTKGDVISINYNEKNYELCILETRPGDAVSIIECDMDVDFAPPVGYQEPTRKETPAANHRARPSQQKPKEKKPVHEGYRLDGKSTKKSDSTKSEASNEAESDENNKPQRGLPDYDYQFGYLRLNQFIESNESSEMEVETPKEMGGYKLKNIGNNNK